MSAVATGFVLTIADGPVLYHSGDTAVFGDMNLIRELYQPSVVMLPIGGHFTMGPKEAAMAVKFLAPKVVLPLHFGTFPPLKGTPQQLAALVDSSVKVVDWKPGKNTQRSRKGSELTALQHQASCGREYFADP